MLDAWISKIISFDKNNEVSCLSYERKLENSQTDQGDKTWFSSLLETTCRWLKMPGSYAFKMYMRRDNPFPGTFEDFDKSKGERRWLYLRNAIGGLVGMGISSPLYLLSEVLRAARLTLTGYGFGYIKTHDPDPNQKNLILLSRNTALLADSLHGMFNMRPNQERVVELANSFIKPQNPNDKPTILCLQEVFCEESSDQLVELLKDDFSYFIHKPSSRIYGMNGGLFIASQFPIMHAEFVQFPKKWILDDESITGRFNIDVFTNKGVLLAALKVGNEMVIVANSHTQSRIGINDKETESYEGIRALQLQIITQSAFDFANKIKKTYQLPTKLIMAGDFNCTDRYDDGHKTDERTRNSFFFKDIFPGPELETWFKFANHFRAHPHDQWPREEENKDSHSVRFEVHYDHVGVLYFNEQPEKRETTVFFDQGYSKDQPTRSSDHAGILLKLG